MINEQAVKMHIVQFGGQLDLINPLIFSHKIHKYLSLVSFSNGLAYRILSVCLSLLGWCQTLRCDIYHFG